MFSGGDASYAFFRGGSIGRPPHLTTTRQTSAWSCAFCMFVVIDQCENYFGLGFMTLLKLLYFVKYNCVYLFIVTK